MTPLILKVQNRQSTGIQQQKEENVSSYEGQVWAASSSIQRCRQYGRMFKDDTRRHLNGSREACLCTLAFAYRTLDESEYSAWKIDSLKAMTTMGPNREIQLEVVADKIENDLILVCATAVEDKLYTGVPQCIDKLAQAAVKIWVLTGDKIETTINIGSSRCGKRGRVCIHKGCYC